MISDLEAESEKKTSGTKTNAGVSAGWRLTAGVWSTPAVQDIPNLSD